jgi:hypothetical protein
MAAMVCLVGMTRDAGATVTINLVWASTSGAGSGVGTNTITAAVGDTITLNVLMNNNQTLVASIFSLNFDTDLANELNLIGTGSWTGSTFGTGTMATTYGQIGTSSPSSFVESTGAVAGRINSWNSGQLSGPLFLPTGTYLVGTARFVVGSGPLGDGNDVFSGLFNTGVDLFGDNLLQEIPSSALVFNGAAVNPIPEPGTVSLLGLGLVGLVLAGRRSRRS